MSEKKKYNISALREWMYDYKRVSFISMKFEHCLLLGCSTNEHVIKQ